MRDLFATAASGTKLYNGTVMAESISGFQMAPGTTITRIEVDGDDSADGGQDPDGCEKQRQDHSLVAGDVHVADQSGEHAGVLGFEGTSGLNDGHGRAEGHRRYYRVDV